MVRVQGPARPRQARTTPKPPECRLAAQGPCTRIVHRKSGVKKGRKQVCGRITDRAASTESCNPWLSPDPLMCPLILGPEFAPSSDRKSTRLNSSHSQISYAVFCLKKK